MMFLFKNFDIFQLVYAAVILDMLISVVQAKIQGVFEWSFLPNFINKLVQYTLYLGFGNLLDYFGERTGLRMDGYGLYAIAFILILVEAASFIRSIQELKARNQ